ncbi:sensor histidine kinase [Streptomyces indicus]|uniref:histidine kinase n=1 Tax=Streptomyces indicus TaxID=417292 RepID=A0A1G9H6U2_9ACTN|nr:histidine kinase [Streptomyces indicus]SDL08696.1 Signal transduction histidine kinase [Streptomyces indicus]
MPPSPARATPPFAGPGEDGRRLWRALAEATGGGILVLLTYGALTGLQHEVPPLYLVLLTLVALGLLVVRRRFPATALLGLAVLLGAIPFYGLIAAATAYTVTRQLTDARRRVLLLLGASVLTVTVSAVVTPDTLPGGYGTVYGAALGLVLAATTIVVPGLVGISAGQQDRLVTALTERTAAAEEARRMADDAGRSEERTRIAAEMHDLVGHRLSLISLHTGGLEMALRDQDPKLKESAAQVRQATRDAMYELRQILGVLGPFSRDTGTEALTDATGTRADIKALVEESAGAGLPVELVWDGPDLDTREAQVRRAVHRVVRESLTNVHKYATGASVTVEVTHTADEVRVRVRNDAPGPPAPDSPSGTGRGLTGLRERVELLGGRLDAGVRAEGGFQVYAVMPAVPDPAGRRSAPDSGPGSGATSLSGIQHRVSSVITALLGLAGVAVTMMLGVILVEQARPQPEYGKPEAIHLGMAKSRVEELVFDNEAVRAAATGREPARPADATSCLYSYADDDVRHADSDRFGIARYCFGPDDTLTKIDNFSVPMVVEPSSAPTGHTAPTGPTAPGAPTASTAPAAPTAPTRGTP